MRFMLLILLEDLILHEDYSGKYKRLSLGRHQFITLLPHTSFVC